MSVSLPPPPAHPVPVTARVPEDLLDLASARSGDLPDDDLFPQPGQTVLGFRLLRLLGTGGFARVYLAQQGELADRPVVLKVSPAPSREADTLALLQHTHIVPVYSVHRDGAMQAVCMPYFGATTLADVVEGLTGAGPPHSGMHFVDTLTRKQSASAPSPSGAFAAPVLPAGPREPRVAASPALLEQLGRLPYAQAVLWLAARLAEGLAHAHERGVIHRDLKPANVLLTDEGRPMLLDFNLAQAVGNPARGGGTVAYMAPEQLAAFVGDPAVVDARADLYAVGLLLWELLAGRPLHRWPAAGADRATIRRFLDQRREPVPSLRPLNRDVTPAAEAIVRRCLEADPARRYPTAAALQDDLDRQLADKPLKHTPEPSVGERVAKWRRRNPRLTSAAVAAGLLIVVVAGLGGLLAQRSGRLAVFDARARLERFLAAKQHLAPRLGATSVDPDAARQAVIDGRAALAAYGLPDDPAWESRPAVRDLDPADRDAFRREAGEWLFLLARATSRTPTAAADAVPLSRAAVALLGPRPPAPVARQLAELEGRSELPPEKPPASGWEAYLLAADLLLRGRTAEALKFAEHAREAMAGHLPSRLVLGYCHLAAGKDLAAESNFDAALAIDPTSTWAQNNRGLARLRQRHYQQAILDFDAVLAALPRAPDAAMNRAAARMGMRDFAGAAADCTLALEQGASPVRVQLLRARALQRAGKAAEAAADVAASLKLTPTDERSWLARGLARADTDPTAALADIDTALTLNPNSRDGLQDRASVLSERLGREAEALATLNRLVALYPQHVPALGGRGVLRARQGDRGALKDAAACLTFDKPTPSPPTLYQVAGIYALLSPDDPRCRREALHLLASALHQGGYGLDLLPKDRDFNALRDDPEFVSLVEHATAVLKARVE